MLLCCMINDLSNNTKKVNIYVFLIIKCFSYCYSSWLFKNMFHTIKKINDYDKNIQNKNNKKLIFIFIYSI